MKLVRQIEDIPYSRNSVITVGTFDGVHLAHQNIISTVVDKAKLRRGKSIIVTFDPHPREVLSNTQSNLGLLTTLDERVELCSKLGVDWFYVINFDHNFSQLSFRAFITQYLVNGLGLDVIIEGYDHHWGRGREGNIESLFQLGNDFGFKVIKVDPFLFDGRPVNSSLIRKSLDNGSIEDAALLLGRPYSIKGKVVAGDRRGHLLGYPTANIELNNVRKLVPKNGIYFVRVALRNVKYFGMASIGERPTFHSDGKRTIEVNILNFNQDIYGSEIQIELLKRLRDEIKYDSAEKLIEQMNLDKEICLQLQNDFKN
jgi:riboflavin kinase / FMN adenylyltransferase